MDQPDYTIYFAVTEMPWPPSLAEEFREEQTSDGFCFQQGNDREKLFLQQCAALNIAPQMSKQELFAADPAALDAHLFYNLEAHGDRFYMDDRFYRRPPFWDETTGCHTCHRGIQQKEKVVINAELSPPVDIMEDFTALKTFFVSRRLGALLAASGLTGFELTPCLKAEQEYSAEERSFKNHSSRLEAEATHFQMSIIAEAPGPAQVGTVHFVKRCPECQAVREFRPDIFKGHGGYFTSEGLASGDFQWCNTYQADALGVFVSSGKVFLLSRRALAFLLEHKITGLTDYSADPLVRFQYVPIQS